LTSNAQSAAALIALLDPKPGERVLDLGCGIGEWTPALSASGARVTGLDRLGVLLEQARWKYPGVEFIEGDVFECDAGGPYDAVFAHASIEWMGPPLPGAKRIHELLKPDGRLAACIGGANDAARQLETYYEPSPREYAKVLKKAGFNVDVCVKKGDFLFVLAWRSK
jgi:trans-aconitate methyltransferase